MGTPLDILFVDEENRPPDGPVPQVVPDDIAGLTAYLDDHVPPKRAVDRNLLIATWNVCHFNSLTRRWIVPAKSKLSPKRDYRCLWAMTEIISRFDVIALQEVGGDLRALRYAMKLLGPNWSFLMTDVAAGQGGNNERMAFLFDTSRVSLSGLAGELVVPDEAAEFGFDEGAFKRQFARNPYAVSFKTPDTTFILVTAHIDFGDPTMERLPELRGIAQWMRHWAANENRWHHNLLVLGDFNLDRQGNELYEAFVGTGLEVPFVLSSKPRTIYSSLTNPTESSYHDQIAWFSKGNAKLVDLDLAGGDIIEIWGRLLEDLNLSKRSFAPRISDHNPLWVEFRSPT